MLVMLPWLMNPEVDDRFAFCTIPHVNEFNQIAHGNFDFIIVLWVPDNDEKSTL